MKLIWIEIKWFFRQVSRSFAYAKHAWGGYDWDHSYAVDMFQYSLERLANNLDSNSAYSVDSKHRAARCRMIAKLMKLVNEDYYELEHGAYLEKLYGKWEIVTEDIGNGRYRFIGFKWEKAIDDKHNDEINKLSDELHEQGYKKQKRAEILLWKLVEHNIKYFWD
jgi:hypothetical protein